VPPAAPLYVSITSVPDAIFGCTNVEITWGPNPAWPTNPGFGPDTYLRSINGSAAGSQVADYPNDVSWMPGTVDLNDFVTYGFVATFSGAPNSVQLTKTFQCTLPGGMVEQ
jgi:hypothetical protein